jgi:hypothetical protein
MTRHDVANLVIRIFALWLGVAGVAMLASVPWLASMPEAPAQLFTAVVVMLPFPAALALWKLAPRLAGTVFDRSGEAVPYEITPGSVPPLASLVVGLLTLADAVPQAASWLVMQVIRGQADASLMNPSSLPALDQRSAVAGTEVVARLVVGAVLIGLSRRRDIWSTSGAAPADAASGEADQSHEAVGPPPAC